MAGGTGSGETVTGMRRVRRRALIAAPLVLAGLAFPSAGAAQVRLPDIGDSSASVWSAAEEKALADELVRNLRRAGRLLDDPELLEYLDALGARLVAAAEGAGQRFRFVLVRDSAINAFAAPGGLIGIHAGLLLAARSEGEVAAVIAHEIAHVTQRHLARAYEDASKSSLPTAAAILAAVLLGSQDPQLGSAAVAGVAAGAVQRKINFTRDNEREADRIGIQILAGAGFDPGHMHRFFEHLQRAGRYYGTQLPEFLLTHPVTSDRLAEAKDRAAAMPAVGERALPEFELAQARVRVLTAEDPAQPLGYFRGELARDEGADASRYGLALALARAKDAPGARRELGRLLERDPDRLAYRLALARVEVGIGDRERGLAMFAETLPLFPGNHPLTVEYVQALLQSGKAAEARGLLLEHTRDREVGPALYQLLARASGEAGFVAEAHGYMAESYYGLGHLGEALRQLELALARPGLDFYLESRLQSRRAELREEMKAAKQ